MRKTLIVFGYLVVAALVGLAGSKTWQRKVGNAAREWGISEPQKKARDAIKSVAPQRIDFTVSAQTPPPKPATTAQPAASAPAATKIAMSVQSGVASANTTSVDAPKPGATPVPSVQQLPFGVQASVAAPATPAAPLPAKVAMSVQTGVAQPPAQKQPAPVATPTPPPAARQVPLSVQSGIATPTPPPQPRAAAPATPAAPLPAKVAMSVQTGAAQPPAPKQPAPVASQPPAPMQVPFSVKAGVAPATPGAPKLPFGIQLSFSNTPAKLLLPSFTTTRVGPEKPTAQPPALVTGLEISSKPTVQPGQIPTKTP